MLVDILKSGPHNGQTTILGCEAINLIGALPHETPQTFDDVGRLNRSMHSLRELVKGQEVFFILSQGLHRFPESACCIWRVLAASWVKASCFVGCSQMPTSSA